MSPRPRYWSEISPGDVVLAAARTWVRVTSIDLVERRGRPRVRLVAVDLGGRRPGQEVERILSPDRFLLVHDGSAHLAWRRLSAGHWSADAYELRRDSPRGRWRILRDGEFWDGGIDSLRVAKECCRLDLARRMTLQDSPAEVIPA